MTTLDPRNPHALTLPNGRAVALGRTRSSVLDDPRTRTRFALRQFVDRPNLPPLEPRVDRPAGYTPRLFANDRLGDCTIVGKANFALLVAARLKLAVPTITDDQVVGEYSRVDGYRPGDPSSDQGGIELNVLNDWRATPFAGVQLAAFCAVDIHDVELMRYAVQIVGALYVGVALPRTAQDQVGRLWDVVPGLVPGDWGGHCVLLSAYDYSDPTAPRWRADTWGANQDLTEAFWRACGDEAYAPLPTNYRDVPGLDYAAIDAELAALGRVNPGGAP